jgi:hypothetical protein
MEQSDWPDPPAARTRRDRGLPRSRRRCDRTGVATGKTKTSFDADVSKDETSFVVPKQYLEPNRIYELEILATEKGGNQTITEGGVFCTPPIAPVNCKKP